MTRSQEQSWLIVAVAILVHAGLLALLLSVYWRGRGDTFSAAVPESLPTVPPVARTQPLPVEEPEEPRKVPMSIGEKAGEGDSAASVDLPDISRSDRTYDFEQAWTRRQPIVEPPRQASGTEPPPADADAKRSTQQPFGPSAIEGLVSLAVPKHAQLEKPLEPDVDIAEAAAVAAPATPPSPMPVSAATPQPELKESAPDPAPAGKSDLDPFAKEEGVSFEPGGIEARKGREVKLVRPRIDLGFMADATRMYGRELSVKTRIETDDTGKPKRVTVVRTSGSDVIDDAVRLALYDSWFGGKMPDDFAFTVTFHK